MGLFDTLQIKREDTSALKRFDIKIAEVEEQIQCQQRQIGIRYLEKHPEDFEPEYGEFVEAIRRLEVEKKELERQKLASQGLRLCENCQQVIPLDNLFCNKCGVQLEVASPAKPEETAKFCTSCGTVVDAGDMFCVKCGAKIGG